MARFRPMAVQSLLYRYLRCSLGLSLAQKKGGDSASDLLDPSLDCYGSNEVELHQYRVGCKVS